MPVKMPANTALQSVAKPAVSLAAWPFNRCTTNSKAPAITSASRNRFNQYRQVITRLSGLTMRGARELPAGEHEQRGEAAIAHQDAHRPGFA